MNVVYWAPRIARDKIKQLYENEAKGILGEDLLNDVAYSLYARCESIIIAASAKHKKVICPVCKSHVIRGNDYPTALKVVNDLKTELSLISPLPGDLDKGATSSHNTSRAVVEPNYLPAQNF